MFCQILPYCDPDRGGGEEFGCSGAHLGGGLGQYGTKSWLLGGGLVAMG